MKTNYDTEKWRQIFSSVLRLTFSYYNLKDQEFSDLYGCDKSLTKKWKTAKSFPRQDSFEYLKEYIQEKAKYNRQNDDYLVKGIENIFKEYNYSVLCTQLWENISSDVEFTLKTLKYCIDVGKGYRPEPTSVSSKYQSDGQIHAVIFDFDGTLTKSDKTAKTTWESLWISLGYDVKVCQNLHKQFDDKQIDHEKWCLLTENKFKAKNLNKNTIIQISNNIQLINGIQDTFRKLDERNIKIYIVSGSIMTVIKNVLENLNKYVTEIKANQMMFDEKGYLDRIIGTNYDFEGKADYIFQIAEELKISTQDILFIGNSNNDQYAYKSGAKTLCINPKTADFRNTKIWNHCIETCHDLTDIFRFI